MRPPSVIDKYVEVEAKGASTPPTPPEPPQVDVSFGSVDLEEDDDPALAAAPAADTRVDPAPQSGKKNSATGGRWRPSLTPL